MIHATPNDWFSEVERYLQDGIWDDRFGTGSIHRYACTAGCPGGHNIEIDPDLAESAKGKCRAPETNTESPPPEPEQPSARKLQPR